MKKIIIDPGHGGADFGWNGQIDAEKNIVLRLALLLDRVLQHDYDGHCLIVCTRSQDIFVDIFERCQMAYVSKADILISLHCNASADPRLRGLETCVYENTGETKILAELVHNQLLKSSGFLDRGIIERPILTLLNHLYIPAVMIEFGFLSNPFEALLLSDLDFLEKAAAAIAESLMDYLYKRKQI